MKRTIAGCLLLVLLPSSAAIAEVQTKTIDYKDGQVELQGHLAWDDSIKGRRPGVLVVHEWWGLNDYARQRAEKLARMGYVAFALDMYGKGKVTEHPSKAGEWAGQIRKNTAAWVARAKAGLKILTSQSQCDSKNVAAIGYCFGGSTVLQLAFSGADVKAVVSFHGSLPAPTEGQARQTKARILVCHGAADSFVPDKQVDAFREALEKANLDYQLIYYGNARHSFTNPGADKRGIEGLKYNAKADRRSWRHMQMLFGEVLHGKSKPGGKPGE